MTREHLLREIRLLLDEIERRWPERVTHDTTRMTFPGTFVRVRDDYAVWVGDHYIWDTRSIDDLLHIAERLRWATDELNTVSEAIA